MAWEKFKKLMLLIFVGNTVREVLHVFIKAKCVIIDQYQFSAFGFANNLSL